MLIYCATKDSQSHEVFPRSLNEETAQTFICQLNAKNSDPCREKIEYCETQANKMSLC